VCQHAIVRNIGPTDTTSLTYWAGSRMNYVCRLMQVPKWMRLFLGWILIGIGLPRLSHRFRVDFYWGQSVSCCCSAPRLPCETGYGAGPRNTRGYSAALSRHSEPARSVRRNTPAPVIRSDQPRHCPPACCRKNNSVPEHDGLNRAWKDALEEDASVSQ